MNNTIRVLCYDGQSLISGSVEKIRSSGCDFVCIPAHAMPLFARKCRVRLELFNEVTGTAQSIDARISDYSRKKGVWVYRIRWKEVPALLSEGLDKPIACAS